MYQHKLLMNKRRTFLIKNSLNNVIIENIKYTQHEFNHYEHSVINNAERK